MPTFQSKPIKPSPVAQNIRKHPFLLFGLPFITTILISTYFLSAVTQTRYDLRDHKVKEMSKEDMLRMKHNRRKVDIREEYFRLASGGSLEELDNWENKRVPRLPGQAEWGEPPPSRPPKKTE